MDWLLDLLGIDAFDEPDYTNKELYPHGQCIGIRQNEPYHDVYMYEDGYEEWVSIGD